MASIEEKVESLIKTKIQENGYSLYDVQYAKEGKNYFLRIFIDKPEGIDLNDCEKVNDLVNPLLDEVDYIKEQYFLEVSSPGIERVLRKDEHLQESIGNEIEIKLFKPENGKKEFEGILNSFDKENIKLNIQNEEITIERKNISNMKLKYNW